LPNHYHKKKANGSVPLAFLFFRQAKHAAALLGKVFGYLERRYCWQEFIQKILQQTLVRFFSKKAFEANIGKRIDTCIF
jgi:hypothetical protein